MRSTHSGQGLHRRVLPGTLLLSLLCAAPAFAQPGPNEAPPPSSEAEGRLFGMEFEFAGRGNRVVNFAEMPFENYERLMREVVSYYGGDPSTIRRVDFMKPTSNLEKYPTGERPLFRAEWVDPRPGHEAGEKARCHDPGAEGEGHRKVSYIPQVIPRTA